jgi:predicted Rossmann fold nucleotide-binding protein DprA/Smf involved in DNA uptake
VFAVPGNITSHLSIGPKRLIQQRAHPILKADDVLEVIAPHLLQPQPPLVHITNPKEMKIIELIGRGISSRDELQRQSGFKAGEFASLLTMLELNGTLYNPSPNHWAIK